MGQTWQGKGVFRRAVLLRELLTTRQSGTLKKYVTDFRSIVTSIKEIGKPVQDELALLLNVS